MPLPPRRTLCSLAISATLLLGCATMEEAPPAKSITPMPGLGASSFQVTARDEQARAWFAQGLQLAYAFEHREAARVFRAALARDPSCAICAWGVAYAMGPNINDTGRGPERDIRRYIAQAQQAAAGASPLERALIGAMAVRYGRAEARAQQTYEAMGTAMCSTRKADRKLDPQEYAYAAAMADVLQQFPQDPDVVTLHADAVMTTMPWRWWDSKTGKPNGNVAEVIAQLAATTRAHPQHTGALHFYVHLSEHSPNPAQAETAADLLGSAAPEAPHLVHMGSHIYKNIGRFADGSQANQQALQVQKRFDAVLAAQGTTRSGRWDAHHLHFLWYSAMMEGRKALSVDTAREYASRFSRAGTASGEYAGLLPLATLVRLQRWDDVLAEPAPAAGLGLLEGYAAHARGMAWAGKGNIEQAKAELAKVQRLHEQPKLQSAKIYGEAAPARFLAQARDTLAGTIARAEKRHDDAIAMLRKAADADDDTGIDPPLLGGGTRLMLAGALLDAGRVDEADKEITEFLRLNGPSAWAHQAQARLADLRGAREEALRQAALARAAWKNAQGADLPLI